MIPKESKSVKATLFGCICAREFTSPKVMIFILKWLILVDSIFRRKELFCFLILSSVMSQDAAKKYSLGGCTIDGNKPNSGVSFRTTLMLEFCCTFVVFFVSVTIAFDKRRSKELWFVQ
ncbi:hypothetical protein Golob_007261 [Gossypium lobatum]|uniref:Uncharacterized protein n=1 Tax=Gossypium lobatum TaxID=34289 RepID=A0A7J8MC34_9ROSI|nr:hypothetical protein [Gossypium lobatum]